MTFFVKLAGASHESPITPNVDISGCLPSKTIPKFNEKTPKRGKKEKDREARMKIVAGEVKKNEILGGPAEGVRPRAVLRRARRRRTVGERAVQRRAVQKRAVWRRGQNKRKKKKKQKRGTKKNRNNRNCFKTLKQ